MLQDKLTYRLQYQKTDSARYISHLDFIRLMSRAARRSGLPVAYSEGFNPHLLLAVALPLPVGVISLCEYLDLGMARHVSPGQVLARLASVMPKGIVPEQVQLLNPASTRFRDITSAHYLIEAEFANETPPNLAAFLAQPAIVVDKRSKSGIKAVDIRPDIFSLRQRSVSGRIGIFEAELPAGNYTLKPELVIGALARFSGETEPVFTRLTRLAILANGCPL